MTDPLFIGVDGGATRTRARLRDARGNMLGEGSAGASNARLKEPAFAEVLKACREAAAEAGLDEADLGRVHAGLGLAGTQQAWDRDFILAQPHPFASVVVDTDAYAAYLGACLYFCSGALDGDVAGCARSTGASFLQSPLALLALCVAALGLQYSAHRR